MFKLFCVLTIGIFLGAVVNKFIPNIDINIKIGQNKVSPYEIGKTKAGEPCKIVEKWGPTGLNDPKEDQTRTEQFLLRNFITDGQVHEFGIKYDCFFDVDTQEYKLEDYSKSATFSEYQEKYVFLNREKSAKCTRYQFKRSCIYTDLREQVECYGYGQCVEPKLKLMELICFQLIALLFAISITFIMFKIM